MGFVDRFLDLGGALGAFADAFGHLTHRGIGFFQRRGLLLVAARQVIRCGADFGGAVQHAAGAGAHLIDRFGKAVDGGIEILTELVIAFGEGVGDAAIEAIVGKAAQTAADAGNDLFLRGLQRAHGFGIVAERVHGPGHAAHAILMIGIQHRAGQIASSQRFHPFDRGDIGARRAITGQLDRHSRHHHHGSRKTHADRCRNRAGCHQHSGQQTQCADRSQKEQQGRKLFADRRAFFKPVEHVHLHSPDSPAQSERGFRAFVTLTIGPGWQRPVCVPPRSFPRENAAGAG